MCSRPVAGDYQLDHATPHPLQRLAHKLNIHHSLSPADKAAILALPHRLRWLEAQSYTMREGDRPDRCAILVSGYAYRHKLTGDGERQILSLHIPGDALDFQNMFLSESDHNVQTLTRAQIAEVPRQPLEDLVLSHPAVGRAIMIHTLVEASIFREWVVNVGRRDARSRISHLLCEFAYRMTTHGLAPSGSYELPITQEQLADATGLTAVHVNRVLKGLQADGLIDRNRRIVTFPDWQRLRDVADFNPRYLHAPELTESART
jgi:CRP-like cAMP-binding protein